MKKHKITYQEVGSDRVGTTTHIGNKTEEELVELFGLDSDEVLWYKIEEIE